MKLRRVQLGALLLLAVTFTSSYTSFALADSPSHRLVKRNAAAAADAIPEPVTLAPTPNSQDLPIKDAPVDGKDGRPHAGPFVETAAERDRKKAKESGDDVSAVSDKKPSPKGAAGKDGALPESHDGVMDDPTRVGPKEGTRGTGGGISEKTQDKNVGGSLGDKAKNRPEQPTEVPPSPQNGDEAAKKAKTGKEAMEDVKGDKKTDGKKGESEKEDSADLGLKKPADLPSKPHDIPHPIPIGGASTNPLAIKNPSTKVGTKLAEASDSLIQPFHSFVLSFTMIICSEIGDKTFLVAALMAMKHPPLFVFSAALPALIIMTVGSAMLGHAVPSLLPERLTTFAAAALFLIFGLKMLREGQAMGPNEGVGHEIREVEEELEEKEAEAARFESLRRSSSGGGGAVPATHVSPYVLEGGRMGARQAQRASSRLPALPDSPPPESPDLLKSPHHGSNLSGSSGGGASSFRDALEGVQNLLALLLSPAWVQTFVMTFLGEWGDRSQIATIAMAAGQDYWWVTAGAVVGHTVCTSIAVIGGKVIAGRVSMKVVTLGGAFAFIAFGLIYLAEGFYYR